MKPDWTTAPEWAKWLAKDEDGTWYWYEEEPVAGGTVWCSNGRLKGAESHWRDSNEQRPET